MFHHCSKIAGFVQAISLVLLISITFTVPIMFMLVRIQEDSMAPALMSGEVALVLRGSRKIRPGDIAVYRSPITGNLVVKRCVLNSDAKPRIENGWLITPWGHWYLSGTEWEHLDETQTENSLFMVGDNQFESFDSRDYGYVPRESFIGRIVSWGSND